MRSKCQRLNRDPNSRRSFVGVFGDLGKWNWKRSRLSNMRGQIDMLNKNLVGRCGHYCGVCTIYRACEDGGELLERIRKSCPTDRNSYCKGCQAIDETCYAYNCSTRRCLDVKGLGFCFQCVQFKKGECEDWNKMAQGHAGIGMDLRENLLYIESGKVEEWLKEQDKKWRCSSCGKPIGEEDRCHHCGAKLRPES